MKEFRKPASANTILLCSILGVAAILRFWNFSNIPFMHDELSALIRSQAGSLSELIEKGKTTDVNPVGILVFLHYWSLLVGKSELMVKLPFIIGGIVAIYYSYKIAQKWFNSTVALFTIAFIATLQFPVMYGQLARPFATGFLFCALMVWCWTKFFFDKQQDHKKNIIQFVVAATLCCYNHYFCLLFVAMAGITGLFFLNKENAKIYLTGCLCIVILFVPHISITRFHFSIGQGDQLGWWVAKSQLDWLTTFFGYLFHFSGLIYFMVILVILASIYFLNKEQPLEYKMRLVAFAWACLPFLIIYFYVKNSQVIQFSDMLFSLPFFLMFIFSFYKELSTPLKSGIVILILVTNTFTLFGVRKHNDLFYKQPQEQMALMSIEAINEYGEKNVTIAHTVAGGFMDYYFDKYKRTFKFLRIDIPDTKTFGGFINQQTTNYLLIGNPPLQYIPTIKEKYPYLVKKAEGFTYSIYCFSKKKPAAEMQETVIHSEKNNFDKPLNWWDDFMKQTKKDSTGNSFYAMDSTMEFGCSFSTNITDIISNKHAVLNVSATVILADSLANPVIVFDLHDGEKQIKWVGVEYNDYRFRKTGNKIYLSVLLSDLELKKYRTPIFKIYLWNKSKNNIAIDDFNIETIKSNPYIYGLYEPIK